mmetsp:Transcript_32043/g.80411  ORF Transcript_32043/g.80411 Transcript_32043/m.80411 type:complete len:232 (-) Transcript_32043:13-708(-)
MVSPKRLLRNCRSERWPNWQVRRRARLLSLRQSLSVRPSRAHRCSTAPICPCRTADMNAVTAAVWEKSCTCPLQSRTMISTFPTLAAASRARASSHSSHLACTNKWLQLVGRPAAHTAVSSAAFSQRADNSEYFNTTKSRYSLTVSGLLFCMTAASPAKLQPALCVQIRAGKSTRSVNKWHTRRQVSWSSGGSSMMTLSSSSVGRSKKTARDIWKRGILVEDCGQKYNPSS